MPLIEEIFYPSTKNDITQTPRFCKAITTWLKNMQLVSAAYLGHLSSKIILHRKKVALFETISIILLNKGNQSGVLKLLNCLLRATTGALDDAGMYFHLFPTLDYKFYESRIGIWLFFLMHHPCLVIYPTHSWCLIVFE